MALEKFTAADFEAAGYSGLYPLLEQVSRDETSHVGFLKAALEAAGETPVQACNYSFPLTTVKDFLSLSQGASRLSSSRPGYDSCADERISSSRRGRRCVGLPRRRGRHPRAGVCHRRRLDPHGRGSPQRLRALPQ